MLKRDGNTIFFEQHAIYSRNNIYKKREKNRAAYGKNTYTIPIHVLQSRSVPFARPRRRWRRRRVRASTLLCATTNWPGLKEKVHRTRAYTLFCKMRYSFIYMYVRKCTAKVRTKHNKRFPRPGRTNTNTRWPPFAAWHFVAISRHFPISDVPLTFHRNREKTLLKGDRPADRGGLKSTAEGEFRQSSAVRVFHPWRIHDLTAWNECFYNDPACTAPIHVQSDCVAPVHYMRTGRT